MSPRKLSKLTSLVAALSLVASTAIPALAAPVPSSTASLRAAASPLTQVRWRGHGGGHRGGWHGHRGGWGGGWYGGGGGAAAGVIGGLILGGIIASQADGYYGPDYYDGPPPGYYGPNYDDWLAYCSARYRSFDPRTGTYLGYDGYRHHCR